MPAMPLDWKGSLSATEWKLLRPVVEDALRRDMRFAIGGGLAVALYGGRARVTKDLDLFVLPDDRQRFIDLLDRHGFEDYFEALPYERHWIYRATRDEALLDIIWQMPNNLAAVDEQWLTRARPVTLDGLNLSVIPLEELIWAKLFVMQRDRCDWPDVLNMLYLRVGEVDWTHLLKRLGPDTTLLHALLSAFAWLVPEKAAMIPARVWRRLARRRRVETHRPDDLLRWRIDLLDRRDWFLARPAAEEEHGARERGQAIEGQEQPRLGSEPTS